MMRRHLRRVVITGSLTAAALLGAASVARAQVTIRVNEGPRDAPPPLRAEAHDARRDGFVWITGRWDWRRPERRWDWIPGHWERERAGKRWREARWEQRDGVYVLVDGTWDDAPVARYPSAAPPPPRDERPGTRAGFVWVRGRWGWQNGSWQWLGGHWERERAEQRWAEGRWELRGDHWEWVEGSWAQVPRFPPLDQPPPAPQREDTRVGPGLVYLTGHWSWDNGQYVWHPGQRAHAQPGMHYQAGEWIQRGESWVWTNGAWVRDEVRPAVVVSAAPPPPPAEGPSAPPPPPRAEVVQARDGFVWARGHHEWRGNHYEWVPGHWERQRAQLTWYDGRWEQRGRTWIYVDGGWR